MHPPAGSQVTPSDRQGLEGEDSEETGAVTLHNSEGLGPVI